VTATRAGEKLTLRLLLPGSLRVTVQRKAAGHRRGKRCLAGSKRHAKPCTAWLTVSNVNSDVARAGATGVVILRKRHGHALKPGSYRALVAASTVGGPTGTTRTIAFRVGKPAAPKRHRPAIRPLAIPERQRER
jgi:hypothetical protein